MLNSSGLQPGSLALLHGVVQLVGLVLVTLINHGERCAGAVTWTTHQDDERTPVEPTQDALGMRFEAPNSILSHGPRPSAQGCDTRA